MLSAYYAPITESTGMGRHSCGDSSFPAVYRKLGWEPWRQKTEVAVGEGPAHVSRRVSGSWYWV